VRIVIKILNAKHISKAIDIARYLIFKTSQKLNKSPWLIWLTDPILTLSI